MAEPPSPMEEAASDAVKTILEAGVVWAFGEGAEKGLGIEVGGTPAGVALLIASKLLSDDSGGATQTDPSYVYQSFTDDDTVYAGEIDDLGRWLTPIYAGEIDENGIWTIPVDSLPSVATPEVDVNDLPDVGEVDVNDLPDAGSSDGDAGRGDAGGGDAGGGDAGGGDAGGGDAGGGDAGGGATCFSAGTPVLMGDGSTRAIQMIQVGDLVASRKVETGQEGLQTVTRVFVHNVRSTLRLEFCDGHKLTTTREHPFFVPGVGFVDAGRLSEGSVVASRGGGERRVAGIVDQDESAIVYNLEIANFHTYFVGENALLVHNKEKADPTRD